MQTNGRGSCWLALFLILALSAGQAFAAPQEAIRKCKRSWIGLPAPNLHSPQDVLRILRRKKYLPLWWWHRHVSSLFSTPVKRIGVFGWTDYCSEACAAGEVYYAASSRHGFYTVDLVLSNLRVDEEQLSFQGTRYLRIEIHGKAKDKNSVLPRKGDSMRICGKLMWDGDGFLEIHPRGPEDIHFSAMVQNSR